MTNVAATRILNRPTNGFAALSAALRGSIAIPDRLADSVHGFATSARAAGRVLAKYRVELKYVAIGLLIFAGLFAVQRVGLLAGLDAVFAGALTLLSKADFLGIFVIAVVANASLLVHIPYTVPVISLALSGASFERMLWAGVWAGLGCGVGEVISYFLASKVLGANPHLTESSLFRYVTRALDQHRRLVPLVVFVCAVSPLPDDAVIIPLAMARYRLRLMLVPLFVGKIIHTVVASVLIYRFVSVWESHVASPGLNVDFALGLLVVFVLGILYQVEKSRQSNLVGNITTAINALPEPFLTISKPERPGE